MLYARFEGLVAAEEFILDSGADITLAPQMIAHRLGLDLEAGKRVVMKGISPKDECSVEGRILDVNLIVESPGWRIRAPVMFAAGNVPLLAGRKGFLDQFGVLLDGSRRTSVIRRE
ncbi:MAG TPA: hypothetical protein VI893_00930 [Thermoplasmata archaeon]|nr:hypothetical protein [Thermoplasmata archaeon]